MLNDATPITVALKLTDTPCTSETPDNDGETLALMGNEAIARGVWKAVRVAAAYPGTPSTEILASVATCPSKKTKRVFQRGQVASHTLYEITQLFRGARLETAGTTNG